MTIHNKQSLHISFAPGRKFVLLLRKKMVKHSVIFTFKQGVDKTASTHFLMRQLNFQESPALRIWRY